VKVTPFMVATSEIRRKDRREVTPQLHNTYWLTNQPLHSTDSLLINCPAYNISARTAQKTPFFSCRLRALA
jgi:hypothetical protein